MTSQEMLKHPPLKPGYWFENVAPLGSDPDWQIRVAPVEDDGKLFGMRADIFMMKQGRA